MISGTAFIVPLSVKFGFVPAQDVTVESETRIRAKVPPGAAPGPLQVRTGRGSALADFTLLPGLPPDIQGLSALSGRAGGPLTITGLRFTNLVQVAIGGTVVPSPTLVGDGEIRVVVPPGAVTGRVTITTAEGVGTSNQDFTVLPPPPADLVLHPARGGPGTPVVILGTGFQLGARVFFNGLEAPHAVVVPPGEIQVLVPPGATTGPVLVRNGPGSEGTSPGPFTVRHAPPPRSIFVAGWYLTQATQDLARSVPLVANRDGLLRVFLQANQANAAAPAVRVTLSPPGGPPWQRTIPAPGHSVPTALQEGVLGSSWNLPVPGAQLQPGTTLRLELDPGHAVPGADRSGNAAVLPLDPRAVPPLKVTLVPVVQGNGLAGDVFRHGRVPNDWVDLFRRLYPVATNPGGIDLQVSPVPLVSAEVLLPDDDGPWFRIMMELTDRQVADGALDRYYFGVVRLPAWVGNIGLTSIPGDVPVALGTDDDGNFRITFAHEMGHVLGREHAPCGGVTGGYGSWPLDDQWGGRYRNARIGIYGYDLVDEVLKDPAVCSDIMAYCPHQWISDWTYKAVLETRAQRSAGAFAAMRGGYNDERVAPLSPPVRQGDLHGHHHGRGGPHGRARRGQGREVHPGQGGAGAHLPGRRGHPQRGLEAGKGREAPLPRR